MQESQARCACLFASEVDGDVGFLVGFSLMAFSQPSHTSHPSPGLEDTDKLWTHSKILTAFTQASYAVL